MKNNITIIGSSNTDMIMTVPHLPKPGETVLGHSFSTSFGGKGANQAVAAARAGGSVTFVGKVGLDTQGDCAVTAMAEEQIDISYVIRDSLNPSGVAMIYVADDGENCISVAAGSNLAMEPSELHLREIAILYRVTAT